MNVGRRVDYAVRALCYLAAQPATRSVPRTEIQLRQGIPPHYLSKILRALVAGGLLISVPGARGGFRIKPEARTVSLRTVFEAVEGPLELLDCIGDTGGSCGYTTVCTQVHAWRGAQALLESYLDGISISDIADRHGLVVRLQDRSPSPGDLTLT